MPPDRKGLQLEVHINADSLPEAAAEALREAVLHTLAAEGVESAEVSVTLLSDDEIRALNRQYLAVDRPTDVIAFSLGDPGEWLGDVYVGYQQANQQSADFGISLTEELMRLVIHGTLHVLGHDHPEGEDRVDSPMFRRQEELLGQLLNR